MDTNLRNNNIDRSFSLGFTKRYIYIKFNLGRRFIINK